MARTLITGSEQIAPGSLTRALLNTTLAGSAVIAKILAGNNVTLAYTGVDAGTGDVTVNVGVAPDSAIITSSGSITSTETYVSAAFPIPAGKLAAGMAFRIKAHGVATAS